MLDGLPIRGSVAQNSQEEAQEEVRHINGAVDFEDASELSRKRTDVLKQLSKEDQQVLEDYLEKINLIAEHDCRHLYVQGAKDCVELLKKLGVL